MYAIHPYNQSSGSVATIMVHGQRNGHLFLMVHTNWSFSGNVTFYDPMSTTRKLRFDLSGYEGDRSHIMDDMDHITTGTN